MTERESLHLLFVCSMNQWRSPTAEKIYANRSGMQTRSSGTNKSARKTVKSPDLKWADIVFVMEQKHKQRLLANHSGEMRFKELHVLDIPDDYQFMDADLIDELTSAIDPILESKGK